MLKVLLKSLFVLSVLFFVSGCEDNETSQNVAEMHWDRDMCERCKMVISERKHAVQVRNEQDGHVYKFDDIGCAIFWFKEENIAWKESANIWITDVETGDWLNAKTAFYEAETRTPMGYGFSAHKTKEDIESGHEIVDYNEMVKRILARGR